MMAVDIDGFATVSGVAATSVMKIAISAEVAVGKGWVTPIPVILFR